MRYVIGSDQKPHKVKARYVIGADGKPHKVIARYVVGEDGKPRKVYGGNAYKVNVEFSFSGGGETDRLVNDTQVRMYDDEGAEIKTTGVATITVTGKWANPTISYWSNGEQTMSSTSNSFQVDCYINGTKNTALTRGQFVGYFGRDNDVQKQATISGEVTEVKIQATMMGKSSSTPKSRFLQVELLQIDGQTIKFN